MKALGKEEISKKNSKTLFAERLILGTRQRPTLPSAMPRRSSKFFFVFGLQIFCATLFSTRNSSLEFGDLLWLFDIFSYFISFT